MRESRRRYNPVSAEDDEVTEESQIAETETLEDGRDDSSATTVEVSIPPEDGFTVAILDFAQSKFSIPASPQWTVKQLKQAGTAVHKISVNRQRLIFRGKLLAEDDKTLHDYGIKETDMIVHLFPKPRVVITNQNGSSSNGNCNEDGEEEGEGGARVPTIVMDADEAGRRAEILVLGSPDFLEAQNNVKLFSFMLLLISSLELLNLLGIAMGVPQNQPLNTDSNESTGNYLDDDFRPQPETSNNLTAAMSYADQQEAAEELYNHWGWPQTIDTFVSVLGLYVAFLGLKATTDNTLRMARRYLFGLFAAGFAWLVFNFVFMEMVESKMEEQKEKEHADDDDFEPESEKDLYSQALQVMILPALVWMMCWMRAWHFQHLLQEAENEATERMHTQLRENEEIDVDHDEELALSNDEARIT